MRRLKFLLSILILQLFFLGGNYLLGTRGNCENLIISLKKSYNEFLNGRENFKNLVLKIRKIEKIGCENSDRYFEYLYLKAAIFKKGGEKFKRKKYILYSMKILAQIYEEGIFRKRKKDVKKAVLLLAQIYERDFNFKDRALYWYEKYLDLFFNDVESRWIKEKVKSLYSDLKKISDRDRFKMKRREFSLITRVDFWSSPKSTRVVVELDGPVYFTKNVLKNPYRVFVDFYNAYANPFYIKRAIIIEGQFLNRIRVGQFKKNISRVVLDFNREIKVTSFHLDNPFRLVIDINLEGVTNLVKNRGKRKKVSKKKTHVSAEGKKKKKVVVKKEEKKPKKEKVGVPKNVKVVPPEKIDRNTLTRVLGLKVGTVVIDPGHGGKDPGTVGYRGIKEKDVVLKIAKKLKKLLIEKLGLNVVLTRDRDVFVPLERRPLVATQNNADLFISIHANSSKNDRAAGIETFYLGFTRNRRSLSIAAYENALSQKNIGQLEDVIKKITLSEKLKESRRFAIDVNRSLWRTIRKVDPYAKNRGVKKAPFVVLIGTQIPSILVEIGFLSNRREAKIISSGKNQRKIAEALFYGIYNYLKEVGRVEKKISSNY